MSEQKKAQETELTDLEPKEDPKGGIIAILIGLKPPAPPSTELPAVQSPGLTIPGPHV
jgi:hypothetical protein